MSDFGTGIKKFTQSNKNALSVKQTVVHLSTEKKNSRT